MAVIYLKLKVTGDKNGEYSVTGMFPKAGHSYDGDNRRP
jgi:hypothetical protein